MGIFLSSCNGSKNYLQWKDNYSKGMVLVKDSSYLEALPYLNAAYSIAKDSLNSKNKLRDALVEFYSANVALKQYNVIDSLGLTDMLLKSSKGLNKKKLLNYSLRLDQFGDSLANNRQYESAILLYKKRKTALDDYNLRNSNEYAKVLFNLGISYKGLGKDQMKAILSIEESLKFTRVFGPTDDINEQLILLELLPLYISSKDKYKEEITIATITKNVEIDYGKDSKEYGLLLNQIGSIYYNYQKYFEAFNYKTEAIKIFEITNYTSNLDYLSANYYLALIEETNNNYSKAIEAYKKVQEGFIASNNADSKFYSVVLGKIAMNYDKSGDYENAINYINQALNSKSIDEENRSIRLMDKAYFYQNMGQYSKSHEIYNKALVSMIESHGENHSEYAKLLNNIGKLYFEEGKFEYALNYFKQALEIIEQFNKEKWHPFYSYMLNDYAKTLFELGDNEQAINLMEKNLNYYDDEDNSMPKNEAYYNRKYSLAKAYNITGNYQSALPLVKESTSNLGEILGKDHVDYGEFLKTLSNTYFGLGIKREGISALLESNNVFVNQINKIFQFSSEQEKTAFMKMITNNFNQMQSVSQRNEIKDSRLDIANLNNQLLLKGLLLNNTKDILSKLSEINKDSIKFKIHEYKIDKSKLSKLLTQYNTVNEKEIDSLKYIVNQREAELVKYYSINFGDGITLTRNWEDIRKQLKEDELAIEFAHFNEYQNNKSTGEISYVAYLITKNEDKPTVLTLFKEKELLALLENTSPSSLYATRGSKGKRMNSTKGLYNLIWLPIEAYLKDISPKKKIYFALSGILNQIPMSALGTKDKAMLSYQYNLYQMGSTHNLVTGINKKDGNDILLIGGVEYSRGSDESQTDVSKWDELPGTLKEVESIEIILSNKGKQVSLWKAHNASERQFKDLDGKSPSLIHIATHGFFFENPETSKSSIDDDVSNVYRSSKDPLLRSGLILAGANKAWENKNYKGNGEDGILTAMEIANLDLSNTSVVVLSACETGLGDINGSEGVYGLQRAFKMAGVDTLIMSLWQVPDKETAIFMETFYKNWNDDTTIRTAFIETQRSLSKKYKDEPFKWAAFVLFE